MNIRNKRKGKFSSLLIRQYILFTVSIIISFIAILVVFVLLTNGSIVNWTSNKIENYDDILMNGDYERFPYQDVFGDNSCFLILDENYNVVYDKGKTNSLTKDEIDVIPEFDKSVEVKVEEFFNEKGNKNILITKISTVFDKEENKSITILDENYKILFETHPTGKEKLTEKEYDYFTMASKNNLVVSKYSIQKSNEKTYTMVILSKSIESVTADKIFSYFGYAAYFFIGIYIIMIILFIVWLNRKVKKPIRLLNEAILEFSNGNRNVMISYSGPSEFFDICNNFEKMAILLYESENKNKRLQEDKQKMLADISHDLKTPITVIQGYAKAVNDGVVKENKKGEYINTIYNKSVVLTELINKFNEYNNLEHPDFSMNLKKQDLCEFMREYFATKYDEIVLNGFSLNVEIPDGKYYCNIDKFELKRVFNNLISNAIKYNENQTELFVSLLAENKQYKIIIADNGVGIPEDIAESLFEPFVVGTSSRNKNGSGLGLAIVKKIIRMHGGEIRLITPPSKHYKTEFEITLPI